MLDSVQLQPAAVASDSGVRTGRVLSLDVFRGGTIAAMIMVNNQASASAYAPLLHAEWHGWTFTDLVFPFFLWIAGMALTLSFAKRLARGDRPHKLLMHVLVRSALIFAIGLFLNAFPQFDLSTLRIPGVLQRIAVGYLAAASIFLYFGTRGRIVWTAALLGVYWVLMKYVPVPGCGAGSLDVDCNFAKWIDGMLLSGYMYSQTKTWDPEGIVSTLPAIATTMFGVFAGQLLAWKRALEEKTAWLFFAGNVMIFAGLMLSTWMPINKKLWTVSYSIFTGGLAFVVFACCYWLIDSKGWRRFARPFEIYGMNALAVYVLSGVVADLLGVLHVGDVSLRGFLWQNVFAPLGSPANASLAYSLTHVLLFLLIAWVMYRRNWIVRV
jgi:predicted acyltransferase